MAAAGGGGGGGGGAPVDEHVRDKLTPAQRDEFTEVFRELDEDGSGKISTNEVKVGLEQGGMTPSDDEVKELIARFDVNGDGELDPDEWLELAAIMFLGKSERELHTEAFKAIDVENKGFVTKDDLTRFITKNKIAITVPDMAAFVAAVGPAKEGQLSFDEFSKIIAEVFAKA